MAKQQDISAEKLEKLKVLQAAVSKMEKNYGKGSIMKLGDKAVEDIETIPTGSISLDSALGVGGFPKGRIIEIYGPESSGKTTLAIHAIAESQKQGGKIIFSPFLFVFPTFFILLHSGASEKASEKRRISLTIKT